METDRAGLGVDDYFASPLIVPPEVGRRLEKAGFEGIRIAGPSYIDLSRFGKLPVVSVRVEDSRKASLHLFKEYALVIALDVVTGNLYADFFVEQKFAKVKRDPVNNPPPPGKHSESASADLFSRLDLPRIPGDYLIHVILLDKVSNRLRVRIDSGSPKGEKEFQDLLASRAGGIDSSSFAAQIPYDIESGPTPESKQPTASAPGIEFRGTQGMQDGRLVIHLGASAGAHAFDKTVWVIATGSRVPAPLTWPIRIRIPDAGTLASKQMRHEISIKAADLPGLEGNQEYWFYLLSGELLSGPAKGRME